VIAFLPPQTREVGPLDSPLLAREVFRLEGGRVVEAC